jgi:hypothetical protein
MGEALFGGPTWRSYRSQRAETHPDLHVGEALFGGPTHNARAYLHVPRTIADPGMGEASFRCPPVLVWFFLFFFFFFFFFLA